MRAEIKALQRRTGITFIYVTHDQAEAMALSDRIVVFNKGAVQQVGTPRDIYEHPTNLFVADFMGQVNKLTGTIISREGARARVRIGDHVIESLMNEGFGALHDVIIAIRPEAISLREPNPEIASNRLQGRVAEGTFLGNIVEYQIEVSGNLLRVQGGRRPALTPGEMVELSVPVAECVVMSNDHQ
jgi:ABC-type Fe3+/spermidine/putrescine transport system ATPase subunit